MGMTQPNWALGLGWLPSHPDHRDRIFQLPRTPLDIPPAMDLAPYFPAVRNQRTTGACTGFAVAAVMASNYLGADPPHPEFLPSELALYYYGREALGTVNQDSGAMIRDVIKGAARYGAPSDATWPYMPQYTLTQRPSQTAYDEASHHRVLVYEAVPQTEQAILTVLALGYPIVYGWSVYESAMTQAVVQSGYVPYPRRTERFLGWHAVVAVGYDLARKRIKFRNSWSAGWGDHGHGYHDLAYLTNPGLSADLWVVFQAMIDG